MSKALAFVTGIAVIIVVLWLLFTPDTDPQTGTSPLTGSESGSIDSDTAPVPNASGQKRAPGIRDRMLPESASHWPDPEATSALPERPDNPARNARPVVSLWQAGNHPDKTEVDGFPATRLQANPEALAGLHVGQQVALPVPELNRTVTARLTTTHNQLNNIEVFRGPVTDGHARDNVVVTRGETSTYVVLSTRDGVYSAVIDNHSGDAVLTSETDVQDNLSGHEDAIPVPGIDQTPPGSPSG